MFKKIAAVGLTSLCVLGSVSARHVRVKNSNDPEILLIQRKLHDLTSYRNQVSLPNKKKWLTADKRAVEGIEDLKKRLRFTDHSITENKRAMFASEQAMQQERRMYNRNSDSVDTGYTVTPSGYNDNKYLSGGGY
ncbi:hypothetical protein [Prochlorococcus sp. ALOHA_ZT_50]|jgi:hypothetical protein|uniref:hypothetical protein n=1 Tax=Prochlorococcus sp. ALOHA_ZT_50 TaxID=2919303 RepID=UPI00257B5992|nr:hypothetical protein [Prochlorococcus sp. ALOHA_ZT_50]MCH2079614.1 hypothetical protein [Prochlorococcus sp. ALOHA_ZT_50]